MALRLRLLLELAHASVILVEPGMVHIVFVHQLSPVLVSSTPADIPSLLTMADPAAIIEPATYITTELHPVISISITLWSAGLHAVDAQSVETGRRAADRPLDACIPVPCAELTVSDLSKLEVF
jgi:hypothetical protein